MSPISKFGKKKMDPAPYLMLSKTHFEVHGNLSLEDLLNITFTAQFRFMVQTLERVPEANRADAKGYFYDMFNKSAARVLEMFAPELEIHPDLTAEAILAAENRILDDFRAANPELVADKVALAHAQREIDGCAARQLSVEECQALALEKEAPHVREESSVPDPEPVSRRLSEPESEPEPFG